MTHIVGVHRKGLNPCRRFSIATRACTLQSCTWSGPGRYLWTVLRSQTLASQLFSRVYCIQYTTTVTYQVRGGHSTVVGLTSMSSSKMVAKQYGDKARLFSNDRPLITRLKKVMTLPPADPTGPPGRCWTSIAQSPRPSVKRGRSHFLQNPFQTSAYMICSINFHILCIDDMHRIFKSPQLKAH
jgi:hypothetical protein